MNIKLISHIDKDGYGCNYLLKNLYPECNIDAINIEYEDIENTIIDFFKEYKNYDQLFITDLSLSPSICKLIDSYKNKIKINYYDHHETSLHANKYDWAEVITGIENKKTCATEILAIYKLINIRKDIKNYDFLLEFIEDVRLWDTWDFNKTNNKIPSKINDLLYLLGPEKWIEELDKYKSLNKMIENNKTLLDFREKDIQNYINKKNKNIIEYNINEYKVGCVFAERYLSQLGNELANRHPEYDLIAMITPTTVSYRTNKENINCAEIAKLLGGGGHPKSAGSPIMNVDRFDYINNIFNTRIDTNTLEISKKLNFELGVMMYRASINNAVDKMDYDIENNFINIINELNKLFIFKKSLMLNGFSNEYYKMNDSFNKDKIQKLFEEALIEYNIKYIN